MCPLRLLEADNSILRTLLYNGDNRYVMMTFFYTLSLRLGSIYLLLMDDY